MITVHVPAMTARADARVVSASISDVPGVRTLRVDLTTRTVQVTGSADPAVVAAAVTATGYAVEVQSLAKSPVRPNSCAATLAPDRIPHNNPRGVPVLSATPRTFIGATTFTVTGMTCAHCQRAVTEEISAVDGVDSVSVDLPTGTVTVTAARPVDRADIAAAVDEAGYALVP